MTVCAVRFFVTTSVGVIFFRNHPFFAAESRSRALLPIARSHLEAKASSSEALKGATSAFLSAMTQDAGWGQVAPTETTRNVGQGNPLDCANPRMHVSSPCMPFDVDLVKKYKGLFSIKRGYLYMKLGFDRLEQQVANVPATPTPHRGKLFAGEC